MSVSFHMQLVVVIFAFYSNYFPSDFEQNT